MARVYLNRPVVLERRLEVPDGAGGRRGGWQTLGTLFAEIKPGRGRRSARDAASVGRVPVVLTVRAAPYGAPERPIAGQRFRADTRIYRILAVAESDASGRLLRCFCEEERAA